MAGTMKSGFAEQLSSEAIPFEEKDGWFFITIPQDKVERYVEIAKLYIKQDSWIEVVGTNWSFIFPDGVWEWDSVKRDAEILSRCQEFEPEVRDKHTVMQMLWGQEFYRDALFHHDYGKMINSGPLNGSPANEAVSRTIDYLRERGTGEKAINYRLRDWLISRQRYWGAPIPMVYCNSCGVQPVPEDQLPVLLPDDVEWRPTRESPLKFHPTWSHTICPNCGEDAHREMDTMDTFMCSSWYHLRYLSPQYDKGPFDPEEYDYWMPVDTYTGGIEHATMHLIYTRFFHKAGRDMGVMKGPEPMMQLRNQGIVLGEDSEKMSKSRGNVVAPDELVTRYGADTVRAYLMFFARWDLGGPWNSSGIEGSVRWVRRVWTLITESPLKGNPNPELLRSLRRKVHQILHNITRDFENFEFNTIISSLMELLNEMYKAREGGAAGTREWDEAIDIYLRMMAPVTPHVAEELWVQLGKPYSIHNQPWPEVDVAAAAEDMITLVVQVNGKVRDRITVPVDMDDEEAKTIALASETVQKYLAGQTPKKIILVPRRLVNIVI
jgi:leucyl-tRNA synthetase